MATLGDPLGEDPAGRVSIVKGTLRVGLHYWANAGSWFTVETVCTFRYQDDTFRLIGNDESVSRRNSGNTQDVSINYLTRKAKIVLGNFSDDDAEARTYWKSLLRAPLLTINDIGSG